MNKNTKNLKKEKKPEPSKISIFNKVDIHVEPPPPPKDDDNCGCFKGLVNILKR